MIQDAEYDSDNNKICLWRYENDRAYWENFSLGELKDLINDLMLEKTELAESLDAVIAYCDVKLKFSKNYGNDYWAGKNNAELQVCEDVKKILTKED